MEAEGIYCQPCAKFYAKQSVYDGHLTGKRHLKAVQAGGASHENKDRDTPFDALK